MAEKQVSKESRIIEVLKKYHIPFNTSTDSMVADLDELFYEPVQVKTSEEQVEQRLVEFADVISDFMALHPGEDDRDWDTEQMAVYLDKAGYSRSPISREQVREKFIKYYPLFVKDGFDIQRKDFDQVWSKFLTEVLALFGKEG